MKTIKCTNCGKRFPKELVATECFDCYMLGAKKEREKERNRIRGLIEDLNYKGKSKVLEELKKRITG